MKRIKHLFTALLLLCTTVATAHDFEYDFIYYNITDESNKTVEVTYRESSYSAYSNEYTGNVVIPERVAYNGYTYSVTSIGERAFSDCSKLTSVVIGNSVTSIEDYAFYKCSGLTSVVIGNCVTSIGWCAFSGCSGLTSIEIPNSVTSIGSSAFEGCSGLKSIVIPNSVTSIRGLAFYKCYSLKTVINFSSLTIKEGSTDYGYAGYYANDVINAPNGSIKGDFVFCVINGFYTLAGYIGNDNEIVLPENYEYVIGANVFRRNTFITSIVIPNSVTSIGSSAFSDCSGLTSVVIGNSVTSIGSSAFDNCYGLKTVINYSSLTVTKGSTDYGDVGYYANNVINAPNGSIEGDFVFCVIYGVNTLAGYIGNDSKVILPENYKGKNYEIGAEAFNYNTSITSVVIPNSVTSIGENAFNNCSGLTSVVIGNSVTSIGFAAFWNSSGLTSVVIPNSVTSIESNAFYGCTELKTVINCSSLTVTKGASDYCYVGYYANNVVNDPNASIEGDFVFCVINGVNTLAGYIGNDNEIVLPENYKGE
ncbi:MAG: leucine-rich repeat domain-containing protein, partial [Bacteroidaceae bacterium]|nr:leucine-rich repeat domain-containing protein [Bacteroidaceae bacterium]